MTRPTTRDRSDGRPSPDRRAGRSRLSRRPAGRAVRDRRRRPDRHARSPTRSPERRCALGADPVVVTIAPRARSGAEPPESAAAAMAAADVVLCAASTSLYHTTAKAAAQRAGARGDFNAPYRADAWRNGAMTADFFAIRAQAERLAELWRTAPARSGSRPRRARTCGATGEGRAPMAWLTGICRNPARCRRSPAARSRCRRWRAPPRASSSGSGSRRTSGRSTGRSAIDGPRRAARSRFEGGAEADRLRAHRRAIRRRRQHRRDRHRARTRPPGSATRSPRRRRHSGTVHIALGDSANEYGGLVECEVHLDGLVMAPTVEFDGTPVVVDGRHVYELDRDRGAGGRAR